MLPLAILLHTLYISAYYPPCCIGRYRCKKHANVVALVFTYLHASLARCNKRKMKFKSDIKRVISECINGNLFLIIFFKIDLHCYIFSNLDLLLTSAKFTDREGYVSRTAATITTMTTMAS